MRSFVPLAGIITLALAASPAQATDFGPLMQVVHATWPEKTHLAVVADYEHSRAEIEALAAAAGEGSTITVLDTTHPGYIEKAGSLLIDKVKPDYLVLLPADRVVWDGCFNATLLVHHVANRGIPTIATTPVAIAQGAAFAMGQATGLDLLVANRLIGTVGVILPQKGNYLNSHASLHQAPARISVFRGL